MAEDITSRFLNVISLFNGFIPIMALQVKAIETPEGIGLDFTRVLDTMRLGYIDEDEETSEPTDRNYWETKKGSPETVKFVDKIVEIASEFVPSIKPSYNKHYIGFWVDDRPCNFAICYPRKTTMDLRIKLPQTIELDQKIEERDLNVLGYDKRSARYRFKLQEEDITKHVDILKELLRQAYEKRNIG